MSTQEFPALLKALKSIYLKHTGTGPAFVALIVLSLIASLLSETGVFKHTARALKVLAAKGTLGVSLVSPHPVLTLSVFRCLEYELADDVKALIDELGSELQQTFQRLENAVSGERLVPVTDWSCVSARARLCQEDKDSNVGLIVCLKRMAVLYLSTSSLAVPRPRHPFVDGSRLCRVPVDVSLQTLTRARCPSPSPWRRCCKTTCTTNTTTRCSNCACHRDRCNSAAVCAVSASCVADHRLAADVLFHRSRLPIWRH